MNDETVTQQVSFDQVNIVPATTSLATLQGRLTGYVSGKHVFQRLKESAQAPYPAVESEFYAQCLESIEVDVRIYTIDTHAVKIVVPEAYAVQLDEVRHLRLSAEQPVLCAGGQLQNPGSACDSQATLSNHEMRNRLLPEDMVVYIDELPDASFFTSVFLLDWANPTDTWLRQQYNSDTFVSAASTTKKHEVMFYRTENNQFVRVNLFHEWSHQFRDHNFAQPEATAFDFSLEMEWRVYVPDTYALKSYGEHFAVLSQELLHLDGNRFMDAARKAPMRASVWTRAFKRMLAATPVERRSCCHGQFEARVLWVEQNIHSVAMDLLNKEHERVTNVSAFLQQKETAPFVVPPSAT